jgi:hypothetical protein
MTVYLTTWLQLRSDRRLVAVIMIGFPVLMSSESTSFITIGNNL